MARSPYRRHRHRAGLWLGLAAIVLIGAGTWTFSLFRFAETIPKAVTDVETRTDVIVVLTGGSKRLATGLQLLDEEKAERLFISGVYEQVDVHRLLALQLRSPEDLECCVELGRSARNTAGNAAETTDWMRRHGFRSMRLVTASYHMPRSLMEFRHAMPEAEVVPHPVFPDQVMSEGWWKWPGTTALIAGEFNKFLFARISYGIGGLFGAGRGGKGS